jgi:hypothetical protein
LQIDFKLQSERVGGNSMNLTIAARFLFT